MIHNTCRYIIHIDILSSLGRENLMSWDLTSLHKRKRLNIPCKAQGLGHSRPCIPVRSVDRGEKLIPGKRNSLS